MLLVWACQTTSGPPQQFKLLRMILYSFDQESATTVNHALSPRPRVIHQTDWHVSLELKDTVVRAYRTDPVQAVEEATTTVAIPTEEAKVIVIDHRSLVRKEEAEIHLTEAEEAEAKEAHAPVEGEAIPDTPAELANRQGKKIATEGVPST
ncbi:uncharacterized protein A4U43_C03F31720 [Asparagus officinalis]|uniref:Uncharacterized protein n=1 Tax=Asparagus officinalis TaxID=4686 RepID=A0A5P1FJJ6_ASPOF|nr:uncharacterized protein A4U43_C03F31720 [Asparagus officinalis]